MIRSLYGSVAIPDTESPYDRAQFRVFYPAAPTGSDAERLSGVMPAEADKVPLPVVVLLPGVNVPPDSYGWLATQLADTGYAVVIAWMIADIFGGTIGLSPGVDLGAVTPDTYGDRPTTPLVLPILDALAEMNADGPLAGVLELDRIAIGGHSAGGTVALQSADPSHIAGICAVFAYGAHTMPSTFLGWEEGTVLPVSEEVPALLIAGELDGVIAQSRDRYGGGPDHDPVRRTFTEGVARQKGDSHLVWMAGANHLGFVHPEDSTTARGFLDPDPTSDPVATRAAIAEILTAFLDSTVKATTDTMGKALASPAVLSHETK